MHLHPWDPSCQLGARCWCKHLDGKPALHAQTCWQSPLQQLSKHSLSEHSPPTKINSQIAEELSGNTRITSCMQANARSCPRQPRVLGFTSGSPVLQLVWMRMVPMRTSLHTARSAGSMVSPARRIDTPVICSTQRG